MEAYLQNQTLLYGGFSVFVLGMLALDLGVFHRRDHIVTVRESFIWTAVWIVLAMDFMAFVYYRYEVISPGRGTGAALEFLTGYLIEKSLSIDNVFVFLLIFSYFNVAAQYQHRVLFWGIIGALIFRAIFIALGALLIAKFHAINYLFGAFLVFTGIKMAWAKDKQIHPERNLSCDCFGKWSLLQPIRSVGEIKSHWGTIFTTIAVFRTVSHSARRMRWQSLLEIASCSFIYRVRSLAGWGQRRSDTTISWMPALFRQSGWGFRSR